MPVILSWCTTPTLMDSTWIIPLSWKRKDIVTITCDFPVLQWNHGFSNLPWLSCTTKSFFKKNKLENSTVNLILTSATSSKTPPTIAVECKNKSYGIKPQNARQITEYYTYHHLIFPRKGWKTLLAHQKSTKSPSWMLHLLTRNISFNA